MLHTVCTNHRKHSKHLVAVTQYLTLETTFNLINKKNLHLCVKCKMDSWTVDVIQHQWKNNNSCPRNLPARFNSPNARVRGTFSDCVMVSNGEYTWKKWHVQSVQMTWLWGESKEAYRLYKMYPLHFQKKYGQIESVSTSSCHPLNR